MKVRTLLLMALLMCAKSLLASPCIAYPSGSWSLNKASALQFEQKWLEILQQKDAAQLNCILAPDFADVSRQGVLRPKEQVLSELPQRQQQYQQTPADVDCKLFGNTAVVRGVNVISDEKGAGVLRIRFTDVLRFTDKRWLAVAAQETDVTP
jgi:Domain of unknown function (DUF4440)